MRILGIDPGSQLTGYGLIEVDGGRCRHVASGRVHARGEDLAGRLGIIFAGIAVLIEEHTPAEVAIERVFVARNADSALKLGQARGAAICAVAGAGLTVSEYSPREVKQAVVGKGGADKRQVQHMVRALLGLTGELAPDAADALAIAICHSHVRESVRRMPVSGIRGVRGGRWR